ncbi:hypothetical protein NLJ89_g8974 [Agrocybe chaxingu]|uniref:Uncharacterized protein n=1 Tax=Agrocybe chaxingu TaxID=84603 RepID=A0A9W8JRM5_9AGAR|nr:hypothetical protein NLJ89_g8974 [Agrocybe chaxingu]
MHYPGSLVHLSLPECKLANGALCRQCEDLQMLADRKISDTLALDNARSAVNQSHVPFIRKFPPEIGSKIFVSYLPDPDDDLWAKIEMSGPLILGAVRAKFPGSPHRNSGAQSYPNSISRALTSPTDRRWSGSGYRVLAVSRRTSTSGPLTASLADLSELNTEPEGGKDLWPGAVDLRSVASRLQQLTVQSVKIPSLLVHFGSLTHLTTDAIADNECLEAMQSAMKLTTCIFQEIPVGSTLVDGLVTCLKPQKFDIEPDENQFLDEFFNKLYLPAPEILSIMDQFRHPDTTIFNFTAFFERCRCPLTHLTLGNSESEPQNMKAMLAQVPTLKHLSFTAREDRNTALRDVLQALADRYPPPDSESGDTTTFLPYLEDLTCWDSARTFGWDLISKIFDVNFENMHSIGAVHRPKVAAALCTSRVEGERHEHRQSRYHTSLPASWADWNQTVCLSSPIR